MSTARQKLSMGLSLRETSLLLQTGQGFKSAKVLWSGVNIFPLGTHRLTSLPSLMAEKTSLNGTHQDSIPDGRLQRTFCQELIIACVCVKETSRSGSWVKGKGVENFSGSGQMVP